MGPSSEVIEQKRPRVLAITQARMSSTRLPGKVLKDLLGAPMLARQMERLQRATLIDEHVVATSDSASDDPIADLCQSLGIKCFRGSLDDVLDRYYQAALSCESQPAYVVRATADCPLIDPAIVDACIRTCIEEACDYAGRSAPPTYPDGVEAECFRFDCLREAWKEARLPSEREHVTPFLRNHPERYKVRWMIAPQDRSELRWTVDEQLDLDLVREIYSALYPSNRNFGYEDVLRVVDQRPELQTMNAVYKRDAGLKRSLEDDARFLRNTKDLNEKA